MTDDGKTHSMVRYGKPETPKAGPSFVVRGWDDGGVFVDVFCYCGRTMHDDDHSLSVDGTKQIECGHCNVVYSIHVMCGVAER